MNNEEKLTLYSFKKQHSIDDESNHELSMIFEKIYGQYYERSSFDSASFDPSNKFIDDDLRNLFKMASKTSETLIPYANFTNTIFSTGYNNALYFNYADSSFPQELQAAMEAIVIKDFGIGRNKNEETGDYYIDVERINDNILIELNENNKNGLKVFYKIIQHTQLALAQRDSLYINQKQDIDNQRVQIDYISNEIDKSNRRYNNMISNFISILGIFAAIMMATFGAVQGFSSIYINENNYTLTEIVLITCVGLMSLILLLFVLMHGVAKLAEKKIASDSRTKLLHRKYPQLFYPLSIILIVFIAAASHLFSYRTPLYFHDIISDFVWLFAILLLISITLFYLLFIFSVRYNLLGRGNQFIQSKYWSLYSRLSDFKENRNKDTELEKDETRK